MQITDMHARTTMRQTGQFLGIHHISPTSFVFCGNGIIILALSIARGVDEYGKDSRNYDKVAITERSLKGVTPKKARFSVRYASCTIKTM